jgi:hypothetical protein
VRILRRRATPPPVGVPVTLREPRTRLALLFGICVASPPVTTRVRRLLEAAMMADPADGTLPTLYGGMTAEELIRHLERWRGRATSAKTGPGTGQQAH